MTILFPPKPNKHSLDLTFPLETDPEGDNLLSFDGLTVSEADYWQDYYLHAHPHDFTYEWHHGILEVKPMADLESALMSRWFTQLLEQFLLVNPVAQVTLLEIGFRLAVPQSTSIRRPDMGLILNSNPVQMALTDHNY